MLAKRLDSLQSLASRRQLPVEQEFIPVLGRPLDRETQCARREPPVEDFQPANRDLDFEFAVYGMEMRRVVIIDVHPDHDPEEARDLGHPGTVPVGNWLGLI
jgi:hypothetical protein